MIYPSYVERHFTLVHTYEKEMSLVRAKYNIGVSFLERTIYEKMKERRNYCLRK